MRPPKISVVIPLYNKALHIERAVESVLRQSFEDFELVIVDDGSTDGSREVVASIRDPRIRLVSQPNGGESSARNRGIRESLAELIAFLDADDSYKPEFLSVIADLAGRHEAAGAFGTSFEIAYSSHERRLSRTASLRSSGRSDVLIQDYFREAISGFVLCSSAVAIRRQIFTEIGMFPEGVIMGGDLDMWTRIGERFPIAVSRYIGAVYHRDATNRVDTGRFKCFEYEHVRTGLRLLRSERVAANRRSHLREYVAMYQLVTASQLVLAGRGEEARRALWECHTRRFFHRKMWWSFWAMIPTRATLWAQEIKRRIVGSNSGLRRLPRLPKEAAS